MEKKKRGKLIYQPSGAAAEYAKWACNLYNGCSNRCEYCYNRHSQGANLLGKDEPTIKGGMSDDEAYDLFLQEFDRFRVDIVGDGGLFFNFVSDPCIPQTMELNLRCIEHCIYNQVPVVMLTKMAEWVHSEDWLDFLLTMRRLYLKHLIKFGFTLTGCDELEPNASTNRERLSAMANLSEWGFYTWASIEPIIDHIKSYQMVKHALPICKEFRFGLNSLKKNYSKYDILYLKEKVEEANESYGRKLVWKESVREFIE